MAANQYKSTYHKIKSLEVQGGFLDGVKIEFDDNLNCIIGGRGTGKTTVIEFIRYAINKMPDKLLSSSQYKSVEKLVRNNLGSGQLRLEIETLNGFSYAIERGLDEELIIYDENGDTSEISFDKGVLFNAEIYSQNEIEDIANDPYFQLKIIDKFIAGEISEVEKDININIKSLNQNALEILQLKDEIEILEEELLELPDITEKLKALKVEDGEGAKEIQEEGVYKSIRDKEEVSIGCITNFLKEAKEEIINIEEDLSWKIAECFEDDIFKGENKDIFTSIQEESIKIIKNAGKKLEEASKSFQSMEDILKKNEEELSARHAKQEKRYRDLLKKYEKERDKARQRDSLIKRQTELIIEQKKLSRIQKELKNKKNQREDFIRKLSELRDKRFKKRNKVAEDINSKLSPIIRVRIEQFGNTKEYSDILNESLKGAGLRYGNIVEKIVKRIPPQDLASFIQRQKPDINSIMEELEIEEERAEKIISILVDTENIYKIETVELYDKPIIELKDGPVYKDSSQLSTGQKCTTILPILLLKSENPLLIDQPEDNLDNAFIFETVVKSLKETKGKRQLIFVTHNPNIPVLGDSEKVFVLCSSGRKAMVEAKGNVDEVKDKIETLLEGGKEAFQERKKRYGY